MCCIMSTAAVDRAAARGYTTHMMNKEHKMNQVIGLVFVLILCPFLGGLAVDALIGHFLNMDYQEVGMLFAAHTLVWFVLYATWFDGSKFQRSL